MHSTSKGIIATYDREIETSAIENEMTIKTVKISLTAVMVALSLVAFSTVVFG